MHVEDICSTRHDAPISAFHEGVLLPELAEPKVGMCKAGHVPEAQADVVCPRDARGLVGHVLELCLETVVPESRTMMHT